MSQGVFCVAPRAHRAHWDVVQRNSRCSAFDGYQHRWSTYSAVRCTMCGGIWRTKAAYVPTLPNAPADWARRPTGVRHT
jgi:hypothetical protein